MQVASRIYFYLVYIIVDHGGRAEYPALFIMRSNRNIQFVGNWDRIQDILDNVSIPVACINSKGAAVLGEKGTITFAKDYLYYQLSLM